jgi:hypothetical protein
MTHCLYCGAEREEDQCLSCGLTSDAAEIMLRRRLVWRTAWFLVGAVLFLPVSQAFPPLELDKIMIFVGGLFFVVLGLGFWMVDRARKHQEIEAMKRIYFGFLPVPWILTVMLFINGKFDAQPPHPEQTAVVSKFAMPGLVRMQRLVVNSWREDHPVERVPVERDDYQRFQVGDKVVVEMQNGVVGIPWVNSVHRPEGNQPELSH